MYVGWAQTKYERKQQLSDITAKNNETKIYVRDLKIDITPEQFKQVFSNFGEIKTHSVKLAKVNEVEKKFGMIDYATKDEAQRALNEGPDNIEVKSLTMNPD